MAENFYLETYSTLHPDPENIKTRMVTRNTDFGNPFIVGINGDAAEVCRKYLSTGQKK